MRSSAAILLAFFLAAAVFAGEAESEERGAAEEPGWTEIEQSSPYVPNPHDLFFRPHVSVGFASQYRGGGKGLSLSAGGRFLMAAGTFRRWGLDATYRRMEFEETLEYLRIGIVLEQVLWKYFHIAIGTVGYVGLGGDGGNPFGLFTGLGYERHFGRFSFAAVYGSELIFDREMTNASSLQLVIGLGV
jgi:hypothetical protein